MRTPALYPLLALLAACAAPPPIVRTLTEPRPDPYLGHWDGPLQGVGPITTTLALPPGWSAAEGVSALATRDIDVVPWADGVRLEAMPWEVDVASRFLADRTRFAGRQAELFVRVLRVPVPALPRLDGPRSLAPGYGHIATVLAAGARWPEVDRWRGRRLEVPSFRVSDHERGEVSWQVFGAGVGNRLEVRLWRAGDGDVALVDLVHEVVDTGRDHEPALRVVNPAAPDDPSSDAFYALPKETRFVGRHGCTLGEGETLVLLRRLTDDDALVTLLAWRDAPD